MGRRSKIGVEKTKCVEKAKYLWPKTKYVLRSTQASAEWVVGNRGSLGCLHRGTFLGVFLANHLHIWSSCGAHLSVSMDSSWCLLPPFVLPLDWGPSQHMCWARKSTRIHPIGVQCSADIPSRSVSRRPAAGSQPRETSYRCSARDLSTTSVLF